MDIEQLRSQKLFPSRKLGDALIVQPHGSLGGYGRTIISSDVNGILQAVKELDIRVVVINLSGANYYGSEMIGMFFQLRRSIPEDVRVVICEPSRDMQKILETMNVQQVIPIYATQKEAMARVAHVSLRDRLPSRRLVLPIVIVAGLLALGVLGVMFAGKELGRWAAGFGGSANVERYQRLVEFNEDLQRLRAENASSEEWSAFSQRVRESVTRSETRQFDAEDESAIPRLLQDAEQKLLLILGTDPLSTEHDAELFNLLTAARTLLQDESESELAAPPAPGSD
jgi:anti-anti-sigma regulatory factor